MSCEIYRTPETECVCTEGRGKTQSPLRGLSDGVEAFG